MAKCWSPPRSANDLPESDGECLDVITGQFYDGDEIDRRKRKLLPERNCPIAMRKDPVATARFEEAVLEHDKLMKELEKKIESGEIRLDQISEEEIVAGFKKMSLNTKRPAVALAALTRLAEMKGMLKNKDRGSADEDRLEDMIEELDNRRKSQGSN